jgi:hypothetical protein
MNNILQNSVKPVQPVVPGLENLLQNSVKLVQPVVPGLENLLKSSVKLNEYPGRCQCLATCPKPAVKGKAFCTNHMKSCPRLAPLSGSEPKYEPDRWNAEDSVRLTHNCFSYAYNVMDPKQIEGCKKDPNCDLPFHQPGSESGYPRFNDTDPKTCPNMIARLMGDNPKRIIPSAFELKCPRGTSKIALVVDEDQDYHFLRQDAPKPGSKVGMFSQKSGAMPVTNLDAKGNEIFDVALADHNFDNRRRKDPLNYDRFCGYFCIPRHEPLFIKTGGRRYRKTRRRRTP